MTVCCLATSWRSNDKLSKAVHDDWKHCHLLNSHTKDINTLWRSYHQTTYYHVSPHLILQNYVPYSFQCTYAAILQSNGIQCRFAHLSLFCQIASSQVKGSFFLPKNCSAIGNNQIVQLRNKYIETFALLECYVA
jgi:hypothetical protein